MSGPFVGRDHELSELRASLDASLAGRGHLVLLSGEPGIGKTRLADEVGQLAVERKAQPLWGRSWEDGGAPAFWPWRQIIRAHAEGTDPETLRADMGAGAADIAQVVPELTAHLPLLAPPPALEAGEARFRLFDSVATFLRVTGRRRPLVLVLDDLHWTDVPSLLLLRFVARELKEARVLLVGTFRDVEAECDPARARVLADVEREGRRIPVRGLSREAVGRYVEATAGVAPSAALVDAVHGRTDGNPLFVNEVVRLLVAEGRLDGAAGATIIPPGVRQTIRRRLERLSPECVRMLGVAAVIGRELDVPLLRAVCDLPHDRLLALLAEADATRLLAGDPLSSDRCRFAHALVREVLYDDIGPGERVRLHGRLGEALEALDPTGRVAEIAHHLRVAAPGGDTERAIEWAERAGDQCTRLLAFEDAAAHYEAALGLLPRTAAAGERACRLRLGLGNAQMRAGERRRARATYAEAAAAARALGRRDLVAEAALYYCGRFDVTAQPDEDMLDLLEEGLAAVGAEDGPLHAKLLARLAATVYFLNEFERAEALSRRATEMAERLGDAQTLASVLTTQHLALWGPDHLAERLATADRMIAAAQAAGDDEALLSARIWRLMDVLEQGDVAAADQEAAAYARLAAELRQPLYLWQVPSLRAMRALMEGRLADAESAVEEALALGARAQSDNAPMRGALQLFLLRRAQGRVAELEPALALLAETQPRIPGFRAVLAVALAQLGRMAEARAHFERLAADGFAGVPRNGWWTSTMAVLAEACAALGDAVRARRLHDLLAPYAGRVVVVSFAHGCEGVIDRHLGLLAATMDRGDDAERWFGRALAANRRLGAALATAYTLRDHGRVLVARGEPARAQRLLDEANAAFAAFGLAHECERTASAPGAPTQNGHVFRREGKYWTVGAGGRHARLRDTKGLRYIAHLLANPGRVLTVGELRRRTDPEAGPRDAAAGPALEARARAEYERRVAALRDQLDEAERFNDPMRAARARVEMEAIAAQLAGAFGLGGRARQVGDPVERMRKAVTNRIRDGLARVQEADAELGSHLAGAIRTGTFCVYAPRAAPRWRL